MLFAYEAKDFPGDAPHLNRALVESDLLLIEPLRSGFHRELGVARRPETCKGKEIHVLIVYL